MYVRIHAGICAYVHVCSCCDADGAFMFEADGISDASSFDATIESTNLAGQDPVDLAKVTIRASSGDDRECAVTVPLAVIHGGHDDAIFAHYVRETLFHIQDAISDLMDAGHVASTIEPADILLIRFVPIAGYGHHKASSFLNTWPRLLSALSANVSVGDVRVRGSLQGLGKICFGQLLIELAPAGRMQDGPTIPAEKAWRWQRAKRAMAAWLKDAAAPKHLAVARAQGVVLSRSHRPGERRITNEDQLVRYMQRYMAGVQQVIAEHMPFWDLLLLMSTSGLVVGAEGGSMINAVFCIRLTPILILLPNVKPSEADAGPALQGRSLQNMLAALELHVVLWRSPEAIICPGDWDRDCHIGQYSDFEVDLSAFQAPMQYSLRLRGQTVHHSLQTHFLFN